MNTKVNASLGQLLADYQVLYQKFRNYHWNVSGPMFFGLHAKFEELYLDAALKVDALAELIISNGQRPPSTLAEQLKQARLKEDPTTPSANDMVRNIVTDLAQLTGWLRAASLEAAEAKDIKTVNQLDAFADGQEKTSWMLRAFLAS